MFGCKSRWRDPNNLSGGRIRKELPLLCRHNHPWQVVCAKSTLHRSESKLINISRYSLITDHENSLPKYTANRSMINWIIWIVVTYFFHCSSCSHSKFPEKFDTYPNFSTSSSRIIIVIYANERKSVHRSSASRVCLRGTKGTPHYSWYPWAPYGVV